MLKRAALLFLAMALGASAQPAARRATNVAALLAYPGFYHLRQLIVVGTVKLQDGQLKVIDEAGSIRLVTAVNAAEGVDEIRGEFWDLGRRKPDDPQLAGRDLRSAFGIDPEGPWPKPGAVVAIVATAVAPAPRGTFNVYPRPGPRPVSSAAPLPGQYGNWWLEMNNTFGSS